ncbi:concanavalin A-like lectin/glucanase domain-containing protein [Auriculariales sp. MPI-PUGE-AT-0066]|nr:concanavalin A-like lectin/glucanase domain-containing protein [Auriculariales sp. MPI-PUGE-AT-0066]
MVSSFALVAALSAVAGTQAKSYNLLRYNAGKTFFNAFQYFGTYDTANNSPTSDYLNSGDTFLANRSYAMSAGLTSVNDKGNAILRVDDTNTVEYNQKRFSVSINTTETYGPGNVFVLDALHIPFGCSVWPAYWTAGRQWPHGGEIDILEQVNANTQNQMALHTEAGCTIPQANTGMTGQVLLTDCGDAANAGCIIRDPRTSSFGTGFNTGGGGIWVTEFAAEAISIWFFPRADVPATLGTSANASTLDTATLGTPVATYGGATCNVGQFFDQQSIVIQVTLCGVFARPTFNQTCPATRDNACYLDWVLGPAANYTDAYFEIASLRVFNDGTANSYQGDVVAPGATDSQPTTGGSNGGSSGGSGAGFPRAAGVSLATLFGVVLLVAVTL